MKPIEVPTRVATDLNIAPALEAAKRLPWSFIPVKPTFDWLRMHCVFQKGDKRGSSDAIMPIEALSLQMPLWDKLKDSPRLSRATILFPGGKIPRHSEPDTAAVLHVVLSTNQHCVMNFDGCPKFEMLAGEAWLVPSHLEHEGWNAGATPRIHLVSDFARS